MSKMKELYTDLYLQNIDAGYSEEQAHELVIELFEIVKRWDDNASDV